MRWIEEEKDKPPFGAPVLGWNECEKCRDDKPHAHDLMARSYPEHGPFIATYHPKDEFLVAYRRTLGDHSWDHYLEPRWSPKKPKYWCKVESPYENV